MPIGTILFLRFPVGVHTINITPGKGIIEHAKGKYNLSNNDIGVFQIVGTGTATITITSIMNNKKNSLENGANISGNWSGYSHTSSSGSYNDITSIWTVPTINSCDSNDKYSSAWIGIDDGTDTNHDLLQTGTESDCISGTAFYQAWYEILPATEQPITGTQFIQVIL